MWKIFVKFCFFWFIIYGCATPNRLNKIMNKLPEAAAKECSERYPIKETVDTLIIQDTALLNQYEVEFNYIYSLLDSVLSKNCDTVKIEKIKEIIKQIPAKPETKVIVKTVENTAKQQVIIDSCQKLTSQLNASLNKEKGKVEKLSEDCAKYKKQRNSSYWWILLLLLLLLRKPLAKLILRR